MSVAVTTTGIHRLVLRSSDLARSRWFYIEMLGFPLALEGPNIFLFLVGDTAIEVGRYRLLAAGDALADHGKYIVVWKNHSGTWKLHLDIWTTSQPAAAS